MAKRKNKNRKEEKAHGVNWKVLIVSIVIVYMSAYFGSLVTDVGPWYESIKPSITPPNWVFPIVWTILFFMIGLSMYYSWVNTSIKSKVFLLYGINLVYNVLWSMYYFWFKQIGFAFYILILLWFSILLIMVYYWGKSRISSYLMIPYWLWVSFAGVLNYLSIK